MIELQKAKLPAMREAKIIVASTPNGNDSPFRDAWLARPAAADGWVSGPSAAPMWAPQGETRDPMAGLTLLVGGPMNGKRIDLTRQADKRICEVVTPHCVAWYERGCKLDNDAVYYVGMRDANGMTISEHLLNA